jgi:hypothetical protein
MATFREAGKSCDFYIAIIVISGGAVKLFETTMTLKDILTKTLSSFRFCFPSWLKLLIFP